MIRFKKIKEESDSYVPDVLYHATFNTLIPSISNKGIVPCGDGLQNFEGCESGVYLSDNMEFAESTIEASENKDIPEEWFNEIVIISIDTNKLDLSKIQKDPHVNMSAADDEEIPNSYIYRDVISTNSFIDIVYYH